MDFTDLPPELVSQMPLVAVLLWIGIQARKEVLAALARLGERVDRVRVEVRGLRRDLGRPRDDEDDDEPDPDEGAGPAGVAGDPVLPARRSAASGDPVPNGLGPVDGRLAP